MSVAPHLTQLRERTTRLVGGNPRTFVWTMAALTAIFWFGMGASALFAHQLLTGVPDRDTTS